MLFASAQQVAIIDQLRLEEALFRADECNYCLAISGSNPSIVMGAFGQAQSLINLELAQELGIPIVRRYSGGGTVVVDPDTFFLSFILQNGAFNIEPYPKEIMGWVYELICPLFEPYKLLWVDNDFCLEVDNKILKVAGNAQSITSTRIVHHISFPWSYQNELMGLLKLPSKRPAYRENRSHEEFLYPLKYTTLTPEDCTLKLLTRLETYTQIQEIDYTSLKKHLERPHRQTTRLENFF